jgi:hypothetical protein
MMRALVSFIVLALLLTAGFESAAQEKKDGAKGKSGTVIGILTAIGEKKMMIEVKADGEEKARKYVPHWRGGAPAEGGGPDKDMLKVFAKLKVGSRVQVKWEFEERLRAVEVKVLKEAPPKER